MNKITSLESLVHELTAALHDGGMERRPFLNLTTQEIDYWIDSAICGEDVVWPNYGDEVIEIEPISSHESFQAMEDFADNQPREIAFQLQKALNKRRPFANFKLAVVALGIQGEWYDFQDEWYEKKAEEWLEYQEVYFKDGRIVTDSEPITWSKEHERMCGDDLY